VVRNTAGLLGLCALGAVVVGVHRAWIAPLAWTLTAIMLELSGNGGTWHAITWLVQPAGSRTAIVVATVLAVGGGTAYALRGCPARTTSDPMVGA
jgi:hypothetical protein